MTSLKLQFVIKMTVFKPAGISMVPARVQPAEYSQLSRVLLNLRGVTVAGVGGGVCKMIFSGVN